RAPEARESGSCPGLDEVNEGGAGLLEVHRRGVKHGGIAGALKRRDLALLIARVALDALLMDLVERDDITARAELFPAAKGSGRVVGGVEDLDVRVREDDRADVPALDDGVEAATEGALNVEEG